MKKIIFMTILLPFLLVGCSNSDAGSTDSQTVEENTEKKETNEEDNGNDNQQNKVVENSQGTFEMVELKRDLGTYESGPLSIKINDVSLVSGTYTDETVIKNIGREDVEYVAIGTKVSTSNEDISFTREHLSLATNTGEEISSPNAFMSDGLNKGVLGENELIRVFTFFLEESDVDDINELTLHIQAPQNSDEEPLGEDIDVDITF
ncbi:hypothetical protein [Halobacillus sp. BAB-2008]|uniref:hypothetical protein n=1 Tax=Halobacillus sp. BAB-2008 TaxID=1246484 RepID=UPI0002A506CD|nr:hypothetical protein [Halobacillus sp. BAB-2008]ELK48757.1 hypothetical protein D479_01712 [Halobacillus sp. BAB-2008]